MRVHRSRLCPMRLLRRGHAARGGPNGRRDGIGRRDRVRRRGGNGRRDRDGGNGRVCRRGRDGRRDRIWWHRWLERRVGIRRHGGYRWRGWFHQRFAIRAARGDWPARGERVGRGHRRRLHRLHGQGRRLGPALHEGDGPLRRAGPHRGGARGHRPRPHCQRRSGRRAPHLGHRFGRNLEPAVHGWLHLAERLGGAGASTSRRGGRTRESRDAGPRDDTIRARRSGVGPDGCGPGLRVVLSSLRPRARMGFAAPVLTERHAERGCEVVDRRGGARGDRHRRRGLARGRQGRDPCSRQHVQLRPVHRSRRAGRVANVVPAHRHVLGFSRGRGHQRDREFPGRDLSEGTVCGTSQRRLRSGRR